MIVVLLVVLCLIVVIVSTKEERNWRHEKKEPYNKLIMSLINSKHKLNGVIFYWRDPSPGSLAKLDRCVIFIKPNAISRRRFEFLYGKLLSEGPFNELEMYVRMKLFTQLLTYEAPEYVL